MARPSLPWIAVGIVALAVVALAAFYLAVDSTFNGWQLARLRQRIEHARTHTVLDTPQVLDGVLFPAGAEIAWEDRSRRRMIGASLHGPAEVLGVRTTYLRHDSEGGWIIHMLDAREIDGWPSAAGFDREAPHVVAGQRLAGEVRWEYDPATYGMGRGRPPVTVGGFVYDPRGDGMGGARRRVVLPWPGPATEGREGR